MESFERLNTSKYQVSSGSTVGGRNGNAYRLSYDSNDELRLLLPVTNATVTVGFAHKSNDPLHGDNSPFLYLEGDAGATTHIQLRHQDTKWKLYRGSNVIAESDPGYVLTSTWRYIELRAYMHDSSGEGQVWVDGDLVIDFTGDTKEGGTNAYFDTLRFAHSAGATANDSGDDDIDDLYITTSTTGRLGDSVVLSSGPDGDGNYSEFDPQGAGSNYVEVDEVTYDDDTTYVSSASSGVIDSYTFTDIPTTDLDVQAVMLDGRARYAGASGSAKLLARVGGSDYFGSDHTLASGYATWVEVWEDNPDTASPWTPSEVNGAEFGVGDSSGGAI
jgi:hypothetical protein